MTRRQAFRGVALGVAMVCVGVGGAAAAQSEPVGRFERTLSVTGTVDLGVKSGSGDIQVIPGGDGKVLVRGEIRVSDNWRKDDEVMGRVRAIEKAPPIEQQANLVRIGDLPDGRDRNISVSYIVTVPRDTMVNASTGSGDQEIGAVKGTVTARTGSGDIKVGAVESAVSVRSGSGDLIVSGARGRADGQSGSGDISMRGVAGEARASTGSGNITIEQTAEGQVTVSSGSGDMRISGVRGGLKADNGSGAIEVSGTPTAAWNVSSASGEVTLRLAKDAAFSLNASTHSGGIELDFPGLNVTQLRRGRELRGQAGSGGPVVAIDTASGAISISGR